MSKIQRLYDQEFGTKRLRMAEDEDRSPDTRALAATVSAIRAGASTTAADRLYDDVMDAIYNLERARQKLNNVLARARFLAEYGLTASGMRREECGDSWTRWFVLTREQFETFYYSDANKLVEALGWRPFYSGPGRTYADDAWVKIGRTRVLVRYSGGLDV